MIFSKWSWKFMAGMGASILSTIWLLYFNQKKKRLEYCLNSINLLHSTNVENEKKSAACDNIYEYFTGLSAYNKPRFLKENNAMFLGALEKGLVDSDSEVREKAINIVVEISKDEDCFEPLSRSTIFEILISLLRKPNVDEDEEDIEETILLCIKQLTLVPTVLVQDAQTGRCIRVSAETFVENTSKLDDEIQEVWFSRRLYMEHGLEPIIERLKSENEEIQILALNIIENFCRVSKSREELGDLDGIKQIIVILSETESYTTVKSHAIRSLFFVEKKSQFNRDRIAEFDGVRVLMSFIQQAFVVWEKNNNFEKNQVMGDITLATMVLKNLCDEKAKKEIKSMRGVETFQKLLYLTGTSYFEEILHKVAQEEKKPNGTLRNILSLKTQNGFV